MLPMEDNEMTQRSGVEHTEAPQPWPCSPPRCAAEEEEEEESMDTAPGGVGGLSAAGAAPCPHSATLSTQGYTRGAWHKSCSVPAVVSKAAAAGCGSCLLLEQLFHWVRWCWELSRLLAVQFSGKGKRRFKHYLFLLLSPAGAPCSWCLAW